MKIIVIFINAYQHKLEAQLQIIRELGFEPILFVTSEMDINKNFKTIKLKNSLLPRLFQCIHFFKTNKNIHHCEVYPGGRFSFIYVLLSKWFKLKCICAERGDLLYFHKKGYDRLTRWSMFICYKFSTLVWYREPYMERMLQKLGVKRLFFAHNVTDKKVSEYQGEKDIDFLWVNRVIDERYSHWFIDALHHKEFEHTKNVMLGLFPDIHNDSTEYVKNNKPNNLEVLNFTNPEPFYHRAIFFVLPAKVVFANHSLLEAMSFGVIPIISVAKGSELIVTDGLNGFICENYDHFLETMIKAKNLSSHTTNQLSAKAKETIQNEFSIDYLKRQLEKMYDNL